MVGIKDNIFTGKVLVLLLFAFLVRLFMLYFLGDTLNFDLGHIANLENLLAGNGLSDTLVSADGTTTYLPTARDLPLHGLMIAATWVLSGTRSFIFIQLVQMAIDSFMLVLVYLIARDLFGERVGFLSAILFAFYLPEAWLSIYVRRDIWVSFATISPFYVCLKYIRTEQIKYVVLAGITLGLGVYFRSTMFFFPVAIGVAMLLFIRFRKAVIAAVIMTGIIVVFLSPWAIRNYMVFDRFVPTEVNFNQSIWEGFGEFPNPVGAVNNDEATFEQMRKEGFTGRPASFEYEDFLAPKVKKVLKEHKLWYIGTMFRRIPRALLVNRVPWGVFQARTDQVGFHKIYAHNNQEKSVITYAKYMLKVNPGFLITKIFDTVIFFLALFGLILALKGRSSRRNALLLTAAPLYFIMILIPIRMEGRYIVAVHWTFLIFMSFALIYLKDRLLSYRSRRRL